MSGILTKNLFVRMLIISITCLVLIITGTYFAVHYKFEVLRYTQGLYLATTHLLGIQSDQEDNQNYSPLKNKFMRLKREQVNLYFSNEDAEFLTAEQRIIEKPDDLTGFAKILVQELFKGPKKHHLATLPKGDFLRSLFVLDNGIAYVDLKNQFLDHYQGCTILEMLSVYSIVNTLTLNISKIDLVKILINGKETPTFAGHIDIQYPIKPNMLIIR